MKTLYVLLVVFAPDNAIVTGPYAGLNDCRLSQIDALKDIGMEGTPLEGSECVPLPEWKQAND